MQDVTTPDPEGSARIAMLKLIDKILKDHKGDDAFYERYRPELVKLSNLLDELRARGIFWG